MKGPEDTTPIVRWCEYRHFFLWIVTLFSDSLLLCMITRVPFFPHLIGHLLFLKIVGLRRSPYFSFPPAAWSLDTLTLLIPLGLLEAAAAVTYRRSTNGSPPWFALWTAAAAPEFTPMVSKWLAKDPLADPTGVPEFSASLDRYFHYILVQIPGPSIALGQLGHRPRPFWGVV